jgi:hypothetical protein
VRHLTQTSLHTKTRLSEFQTGYLVSVVIAGEIPDMTVCINPNHHSSRDRTIEGLIPLFYSEVTSAVVAGFKSSFRESLTISTGHLRI